jgi:putative phage-type endonuclease
MTTELKQGTPEWFEARIGRITGSRVGGILGCSPFKSRQATLRDMVLESIGQRDDFDNPAMAWGRDNEDKALSIYEFLYAGTDEVTRTGFWTSGDNLGASPDALVGSKGMVEIKCPYKLKDENNPMFDSIEELPHYWHQMQLQLLCADREWCDFFQWAPNGHRHERVYRDENWLEEHEVKFDNFMAEYRKAVENAAQGGPEDRVGASARWAAASEAYRMAKQVKEAAESDMTIARDTLIELCDEANIDQCTGAGMSITRIQKQGAVDYKLMAQDNLPNFSSIQDEYRRAPSVQWRVTEEKN